MSDFVYSASRDPMVARRPPEGTPVFTPAASSDRVVLRGLDEFLRKPYVRVNAPPVGVGATTQGSSNDPTGAGTGDVEGGESGGSAFAFSRSELGAAAAVGAVAMMAGFVLYSNKDAAAERWREWRRGEERRRFLELSEDI